MEFFHQAEPDKTEGSTLPSYRFKVNTFGISLKS